MAKSIFSRLTLRFGGTDEEAMARVQEHDDHRAFTQLVERWDGPIRDLCTRMTGDSHRGEDLRQITFARVFEKRKAYRQEARFSTWLWRVALNICYDELRRTRRRQELSLNDNDALSATEEMESAASDEPSPDLCVAGLEEGEIVRQALIRMPERYRTVIVLRFYEDLKLDAIAEVLEIPVGTVNSRLAAGLEKLTRLLEPKLNRAAETPTLRISSAKECLVV